MIAVHMETHQLHLHPLKKHKLKVTKSRKALLQVLETSPQLLSADDIFEKVNKHVASDRATIYRTLHTFESLGIIDQVQLNDGLLRYEIAHEHGHHHHVVCTGCGVVEHISDAPTEKALHNMSKKLKQFSVITEHTLELFGICKKCVPKHKV
ncbi:MAG: hypothetical protein RL094_644 [Candidatus Parcubacteria bacterium]|jgi:Fe2+ or Zn2+ uptake regulation protein